MGGDGVHGAERVDEGGAGVHGHGDTESFRDFFLGGASFKGSVSVEGDATIAARGDSDGHGDELADFFAEKRVGGIGSGKSLIALQRVGREFRELRNEPGEIGLIGVPVKHHEIGLQYEARIESRGESIRQGAGATESQKKSGHTGEFKEQGLCRDPLLRVNRDISEKRRRVVMFLVRQCLAKRVDRARQTQEDARAGVFRG